MITKIASDFRTSATFASNNEVALFRKLADAIVNNSRAIFIDETHGATKCNVSFKLTTGALTRCEISDLLIISKSKRSPLLRATFWQAKKEAASKWVAVGTKDEHVDFGGQFNQWDLLSRRPSISGVLAFHPPHDLLSSFDSPSIGSFGIFYERASTVELIHSVAEFIICNNPNTTHPTLVANAFLSRYFLGQREIITRAGLIPFLEALFAHQIGAQLLPTVSTHEWIVDYARQKVAASGQSSPRNFFSSYGRPIQTLNTDPAGDGVSVLLVDADPPD